MAKMRVKFLKSHYRFGYFKGEEAEIEQILVETLKLETNGFVEVVKRPMPPVTPEAAKETPEVIPESVGKTIKVKKSKDGV